MSPAPDEEDPRKALKSVDDTQRDDRQADQSGQASSWRRMWPKAGASTKATPPMSAEQGGLAPLAKSNKPTAKVSLRASISELLLISKLRASSFGLMGRSTAAEPASPASLQSPPVDEKAVMLARYANILSVTCQHWFHHNDAKRPPHHRRL